MDANQDEQLHPASATFSRHVKDRALKILLDYSALTKRKWGRIRDEIVSLTGAPDDPDRPTLSRQSLEHWAAGTSDLGDTKFYWVHKFLTHPDTSSRSDFAGLESLADPIAAITATGSTLARFSDVGDIREVAEIALATKRNLAAHREPAALAGLYEVEAPYVGGQAYLSLTAVAAQAFMIAHLLVPRPSRPVAPETDWDMDRFSGYAVPGQITTLFLKHRNGATLNIDFGRRDAPEAEDQIFGRMHTDIINWVQSQFARIEGPPDRRFVYRASISIKPIQNNSIQNILDNVVWSVQF